MDWATRDPDFARRVAASFARQGFMVHLGAQLVTVRAGAVEISLPLGPHLSQQHGYGHAGAAWAIADSASGFAAMSLLAPGDGILTVELKINLLAPARGERLVARGRVERPGRTLTVCRSDVLAVSAGTETPIATTLGTFMCLAGLESGGPADS